MITVRPQRPPLIPQPTEEYGFTVPVQHSDEFAELAVVASLPPANPAAAPTPQQVRPSSYQFD
jgi:hypothetical protein